MRREIVVLALFCCSLGLAVCGCEDGTQQGKFIHLETETFKLSGNAGSLTRAMGGKAPFTDPNERRVPLLYILTISPGGNGSASSGRTISKFIIQWDPTGRTQTEVSWDRWSDKVHAAGVGFDRTRGNVFIVERDTEGKVTVIQASSPREDDPKQALVEIQQSLQPASAAKGATLLSTGPGG